MPEPLPTPSDAELARYLTGAANQPEAQMIQRWLELAPEHQQRLEELRLVLGATEPPRMLWDRDASWRRLAEQLEPARRPEVVRPRLPRLAAARRFALTGCTPVWLGRALLAAGLGAVAVTGWYLARRPAPRPVAEDAAPVPVAERRTGRGERVSFRLPDGTGVMLGPVSRLRYSADYGRGERAVELEGDGYFDVFHDPSRPFAVRTPTALVRDIGTRFALRARSRDRDLEVVVAEGSVAVGRSLTVPPRKAKVADRLAARHALPADSVVLIPGDFARLPDSGRAAVRRGVDVQRYLGWTEGRLVFERAPLPVVIEELERWYDVEIQLASGDLKTRMLTATFRDKPINDVLALLAASLDIDVSRTGQRFVLSNR